MRLRKTPASWRCSSALPGCTGHSAMSAARPRRCSGSAGLLAGAASNMVGLAYIAAAQHRNDDALALLDEADAMARADQAHRILHQVSQARTELSDQHPYRPA
jgi:hypothetical protein